MRRTLTRAIRFGLALGWLPLGLAAQELPPHMQRQAEITGKKLLDHDVYDTWRNLRNRALSPDGLWMTFRYGLRHNAY